MKTIMTSGDLDAVLREEHSILFTFFDWSGQAHSSLRVFEDWEREWRASHPVAPVGFYRLDPDSHRESWDWLVKQTGGSEGMEGGYGSVTWLRNGKGVGFIRYAAQFGKNGLSRLTDEYFGSAIAG